MVLGLEELAAAAVGPAASRLSFAVGLASISRRRESDEKRGDAISRNLKDDRAREARS